MRRLLAIACAALLGCHSDPPPGTAGCQAGNRSQCLAQLTVGGWFGCALLVDHRAWCWGRNAESELDYDTTDTCPVADGMGNVAQVACHTFPLEATGAAGSAVITAGDLQACALQPDGTANCWGENSGGQLGDGTTITRAQPMPVKGLSDVRQLSLSATHSCALTGGGLVCWGTNGSGQLGNGAADSPLPLPVQGVGPVAAVAVGAGHSCALLQSGEVWCWGANQLGQLGRGAAGAASATPGPVVTDGAGTHLSGVTAVASHLQHTCAIRGDGAVLCWGRDPNGELGASPDGPVDCGGTPCRGFASPVMRAMGGGDAGVSYQAAFASPARAIATGWSHSCALLGDGTVACWGYDGSGELGGAPGPPDANPRAALAFPGASTDNPLRDVAALSAGGASTCAVLTDGSARCWGWNATGKLGDGSYDQTPGPVPVAW